MAVKFYVKSETSNYAPYKFDDCKELLGKVICKRYGKEVRTIISYREDKKGTLWFGDVDSKSLLREWKFSDGKICGIKKE